MSIGNLSKIPLYIKCYFEMPRTFLLLKLKAYNLGYWVFLWQSFSS